MNAPLLAVGLNASSALMSSAAVNADTMGANVLVAGISNEIIRCYRLLLVATTAVAIEILDGDTVLLGPMSMAAGAVFLLPFDSQPWAVSSAGNALQLNLSAGVQVGGGIFYVQG
jgi:hypothetical protein